MQPEPMMPIGSRPESSGLESEVSHSGASKEVLSTIQTYTFDEFRLTSPPARLSRSGRPVEMRSRALQVLELLVSHAGNVVSRDELRAYLWGTERFVDHEHGINTLLHEVRRVLGDDSQHPRYIETVRGSGYRFIAHTQVAEEPLFTRVRNDGPAPPARTLSQRALPILLGLAVVAGISWGARETLVPGAKKAVIRIAPMKGTVSVPLATDLCETLKADLKGVLAVNDAGDFEILVEHSNSAAKVEGETIQRADLLVASTLYVLPNAYRIELELVDTQVSTPLWSHVYELPAASLKMWPQLASKDLALELHRVSG